VSFAGETLLVTGFPGFHARNLALYLLAAEPDAKVVLLRRASDRERSEECLARLDGPLRQRARELEGDPAALDFGLSGAEYLELAASVQRVYHFASVLEARRRTEAAAHNIACAREVLAGKCPNCGGELVSRPRRPVEKLAKYPPSQERVRKPGGCAKTA